MLQDLEAGVAALIAEIGRIERESEGTYLALGELFPRIVAELERSARNSETSLSGFSRLADSKSGLRSMRNFAAESSAFFRSLHERDAAFLARINESIERLSSLEALIARVRSDSEEMEIISLNAMTVALKSGNAGKAFSVITDELKRLSGRTIGKTEEITARGRDLMDWFSRLRDTLRELDEFQAAFFGELDRALSGGYDELEAGVVDAGRFFGDLMLEAKAVSGPVQRIMQEVQLQDIIRQSLQHVTISLEEAKVAAAARAELDARGASAEGEAKAAASEELAYVAAIAELSASLVEDIRAKLDASAYSFGRDIESVRAAVEAGESKRRDYIEGLRGDQELDTSAFSAGSATYLSLKKTVIQTARRLAEQVRSLDESFKSLSGLLTRFQNIVVASRIEVARNRALHGVDTTVHGMIELTERIAEDVGGAMATTKGFIKVASAAISEYAIEDAGGQAGAERAALGRAGRARAGKGRAAKADSLLATMGRIESDVGYLEGARRSIKEAIGGFALYTPEFLELIGAARSELGRIEALSARLGEARRDLERLRQDADRAGGSEGTAGIHNERLRNMIERFTIFTHKKAAGEIGSFEVESGAESGEVTLF